MDQSTGRRIGEPNLTAPPMEGLARGHGSCALTQLYSVSDEGKAVPRGKYVREPSTTLQDDPKALVS